MCYVSKYLHLTSSTVSHLPSSQVSYCLYRTVMCYVSKYLHLTSSTVSHLPSSQLSYCLYHTVMCYVKPRLPNAEAEWTVINNELPNLDFDDFANVDEGVSVYGSLSDQDIIATVTSEDVLSDDDNDDGMEQPPDITTKEAKTAVNTLRSYLEQSKRAPLSVVLPQLPRLSWVTKNPTLTYHGVGGQQNA
ncbi:hypothetical protein J6590_019002 [Homalodisca vitripennis]|nr:hypothetical protein J6590_019002 [Homalodisca vitripennis]